MPTVELYFLRSSEQKIVSDMLKISQDVYDTRYSDFFGLTKKDLGLYAMKESVVCGAIWSRELDAQTPILNIAVLPAFRNQGIATSMINQFLLEAAAVYEKLSIATPSTDEERAFLEKFGFEKEDKLMIKTLKKAEVIRPTDGYDPRKWMD